MEGLGICWATFGLKVPILLNWVKLRPGVWNSGTISSTGWGAICDRAPTRGCLGLALIMGSKQCGMDILPIFWLRFGSSLLMWMASLASQNLKTLKEDPSCVVLTADKGVTLVVMDKSQYIDKCMALLNDTKVYKPCKDTTKKLHRDIQESLQRLNREHGTSRLYDWSKLYYNKLLPTGNSSPAPRFYGLPKIHKANCPMCPIVSACGTATY